LVEVIVEGILRRRRRRKRRRSCPHFWAGRLWVMIGNFIFRGRMRVNVIVLGPWGMLNAGTGSHTEILILIALIRTVKRWLKEEYWAWLCKKVLDGLR